ncbi:hypothetical protein QWY75_13235 [Pontixanthobacter aestiaquae]|uniref:Uncharacterized protein n=1 Tax=Pontixanthobacter aestiaquae TaxID=1509367 RepID=A0A844Z1P2_9SPHN|nr:hypothetical protein [Pontixanthobacter aestiaquae]MDN3647170.1 hypothetical protein [Pontixanthobacter aestiaquae]MXO81855.1 hypothetical protein [Pontixanthobacter aestiaquae]
MKKLLTIAAAVGVMTLSTQAQAGAAAVCIEKDTNSAGNSYDMEYFMRWGKSPNVDGFTALRAAKRDHKRNYPSSTPYCRHTGTEKFKDGGYYVLIKSGREKDSAGAHMNKWALGFGIDRTQAIIDAKKEMRRRDSLWVERTHGYEIDDEDEI